MSAQFDRQRVLDSGLVAILRAASGERLPEIARAVFEGGIDILEVTFTVPGAIDVLRQIRAELGERALIGAGTVLDTETARAALLAGADFLVSPTLNLDVIRLCRRYDKLVMPGAFTPTEVLAAWEAGADFVKIFPADVAGPAYLKALRGPLPQVRLMPTGGVTLSTLREFFDAGASAVGLGSALLEQDAVRDGNTERIRSLAAQFVERRRAR
ncbi:MAG: bifunctional 4-hydroxy-2-oxoglutarate aldolase/2-dehydro-3-deoxy-phosphogluconate aldolase [Planctomycetaceae bacterium]